MIKKHLWMSVALVFCAGIPVYADDLYGGVGRGSGVNAGGLLRISDVNGSGVLIGNPVGPLGLNGISFNGAGQLFGSTIAGGGSTSTLVQIDPGTGGLINTVGSITDAGNPISIGDLAFQPGTGVLFGVRSNTDGAGSGGFLYTINTATGVATFVGDTGGGAGGGIAFAPDGTLYQTGYNSSFDFTSLNVINSADASRVSTVAVNTYFDGLAVRADGTLFASGGGPIEDIFVIDPITGGVTSIGLTGAGAASDLAFLAAVPEPSTFVLIGLGVAGAWGYRWRRQRILAKQNQ